MEGSNTGTADNWRGVHVGKFKKLIAAWDTMPIKQESATQALTSVLGHAGCSVPSRDSVDRRLVKEVQTGQATHGGNGIITKPSDVGGWPKLANQPACHKNSRSRAYVKSILDGITPSYSGSSCSPMLDVTLSTDVTSSRVRCGLE